MTTLTTWLRRHRPWIPASSPAHRQFPGGNLHPLDLRARTPDAAKDGPGRFSLVELRLRTDRVGRPRRSARAGKCPAHARTREDPGAGARRVSRGGGPGGRTPGSSDGRSSHRREGPGSSDPESGGGRPPDASPAFDGGSRESRHRPRARAVGKDQLHRLETSPILHLCQLSSENRFHVVHARRPLLARIGRRVRIRPVGASIAVSRVAVVPAMTAPGLSRRRATEKQGHRAPPRHRGVALDAPTYTGKRGQACSAIQRIRASARLCEEPHAP